VGFPDISRTKPLVRLVLNQIGRRLTEDLQVRGHRILLMLDEFPALGRLDFFESALAFMAGYGLKSFLIAQSLYQIEKAYGPNTSILDNCHVRVAFATNDERTRAVFRCARHRHRDARHQNYRHRFSPRRPYLMVSRQETAQFLLTPAIHAAARRQLVSFRVPPKRAHKGALPGHRSRAASCHHLHWSPPARAPPATDLPHTPTTGQLCPSQSRARQLQAGRSPAPWPTRIRRMEEFAASRLCPSTKRSPPSNQNPAPNSPCSKMTPTMTLSAPRP
jgi:hypothetical protein